jgi:hypothetical protein
VATEAAKKGVDRFILLSDRVEDGLATPPWGKAGTVASQGPVLSDEGDRDYNGWRGINGAADSASGKAYLEGVVNLQEMYDEVPSAVYIAVAEYESQDGGMLVLPDSENLDALHYIRFDL